MKRDIVKKGSIMISSYVIGPNSVMIQEMTQWMVGELEKVKFK